MESFILYQIKSACCISLFGIVYLLFIRNLTFYRLNRFYLLSSLVISLLIPVINIDMPSAKSSGMVSIVLDTLTVNAPSVENGTLFITSWTRVVKYIYLAVSMLFAGFFLFQIRGLVTIIRRHGIQRKDSFFLVPIPENLPAFSFFNVLFINTSSIRDQKGNPVLQHEMAHARQFHSADILLVEGVKIMQWFNPFVYILQKLLKETHEYLADEAVLEQNSDSSGYRLLLLSQVFGIQPGISNHFNHSLIKKRFTMMTKEKSPFIRQVRYLLVLPMAIILLLFFSSQERAFSQENKKAEETVAPPPPPPPPPVSAEKAEVNYTTNAAGEIVYYSVDQMPEFQGGSLDKVRSYVQQNITYPAAAKKSNLQGKVFVQWIVDEDGRVVDVKVVRSLQPEKEKEVVVVSYKQDDPKTVKEAIGELDAEAIRVISSMPAWKPGMKDGKPVKVTFTMPISFALQEK